MSKLSDQLRDVVADSSPAENDTIDEDLRDELDADPETDDSDDKKKKDDDRPLINLKSEFDRKFKKIESVIERVENSLSAIASSRESSPAPRHAGEKRLEDMSVQELRALRPSVTDEAQKVALEDYIADRIADDRTRAVEQRLMSTQRVDQGRQSAAAIALQRYPDLRDENSDFHQAVNDRLIELGGEEYTASDPRALLNVANEIAIEQGVTPRRRDPRNRVATRNEASPLKPDTKDKFDEGKHKVIANALRHALPKGKTFDMKKIRERRQVYRENMDVLKHSKL